MTEEQHRKEQAYSKTIRDAEAETVRDILSKNRTPEGLANLIKNAAGFAEAKTNKDRPPDNPAVACKPGCNWCCYQNVLVSAPEVFRIVRFVKSEMSASMASKVSDRLHKLDRRTRGTSKKRRADLHLPCAFLDQGRCTIYAVRPLACAEFTSFNVDDCKRAQRQGFPMGSVIHEKIGMIVYRGVMQGLFEGLGQALPGSDTAPLELTAAVVSVLNKHDAEQSWLDGTDIFADAHLGQG